MIPLPWAGGAVAVALAAGLAAGYVKGHHDGYASLRADWDKQQLAQQREYINRLRDQSEQIEVMRLQEHERQSTYETNLRGISRQRDTALASLRNRPERVAVPASGAGDEAAESAAGIVIPRRNAEALVDLAARADELRAALARCQGGDVTREGGRLDH